MSLSCRFSWSILMTIPFPSFVLSSVLPGGGGLIPTVMSNCSIFSPRMSPKELRVFVCVSRVALADGAGSGVDAAAGRQQAGKACAGARDVCTILAAASSSSQLRDRSHGFGSTRILNRDSCVANCLQTAL